jgi:rhombotail lipoprotein
MKGRISFLTTRKSFMSFAILLIISFIVGCGGGTQIRHESSVVQYLAPDKDSKLEIAAPNLSFPIKVGIAFVPDGLSSSTVKYQLMLNETQKTDLMQKIVDAFKKEPLFQTIHIIPSQYLRPGGSFTNLNQLRATFGIDVIILLSYEQIQHTDRGALSVMYWTGVGVYMIKGEKNDTNTVVDAAVYHIPGRNMLFSALGTSQVKASSTMINLSEQSRIDSHTGFEKAFDNLTIKLKDQLEQFKVKVKN